MPKSRALPPLDLCLGTSPSQAANSRPFRKQLWSPAAATRAVAVIGPTPSIRPIRWQASFVQNNTRIRLLKEAMRLSSSANSSRISITSLRIISGTPSPLRHPFTIRRRAWRRRLMSRAITKPCSANKPRIWFTSRVRSEISLCRMRWTACISSCSGDFCGTNRIEGRPTASQIASASLQSFLLDLT